VSLPRVLVLDDDPERHDWFRRWYGSLDYTAVHTATQAIQALDGARFDVIFLDHDLGDFATDRASGWTNSTGYDVVQFMVSELPEAKRPELVAIHSWNPAGAQRMQDALMASGIRAILRPFSCAKYPVHIRGVQP
jgi:CheY-like chemotaxis protein